MNMRIKFSFFFCLKLNCVDNKILQTLKTLFKKIRKNNVHEKGKKKQKAAKK